MDNHGDDGAIVDHDDNNNNNNNSYSPSDSPRQSPPPPPPNQPPSIQQLQMNDEYMYDMHQEPLNQDQEQHQYSTSSTQFQNIQHQPFSPASSSHISTSSSSASSHFSYMPPSGSDLQQVFPSHSAARIPDDHHDYFHQNQDFDYQHHHQQQHQQQQYHQHDDGNTNDDTDHYRKDFEDVRQSADGNYHQISNDRHGYGSDSVFNYDKVNIDEMFQRGFSVSDVNSNGKNDNSNGVFDTDADRMNNQSDDMHHKRNSSLSNNAQPPSQKKAVNRPILEYRSHTDSDALSDRTAPLSSRHMVFKQRQQLSPSSQLRRRTSLGESSEPRIDPISSHTRIPSTASSASATKRSAQSSSPPLQTPLPKQQQQSSSSSSHPYPNVIPIKKIVLSSPGLAGVQPIPPQQPPQPKSASKTMMQPPQIQTPYGRSAAGVLAEEREAFQKEKEEWNKEKQRLQSRLKYTRDAMMQRLRRTEIELACYKLERVMKRRHEKRLTFYFRHWKRNTDHLHSLGQKQGEKDSHSELVQALLQDRQTLVQQLVLIRAKVARVLETIPAAGLSSPTYPQRSIEKQKIIDLYNSLRGMNSLVSDVGDEKILLDENENGNDT